MKKETGQEAGLAGWYPAPLGVVLACHAPNYALVKAGCASIRHYSPQLPICVVLDGDFDVRDLTEAYGVQVLRVSELRDERLRKLCPGSPRAKLAAIWEGPFERFLYMDADAIFWGDVGQAIARWTTDFLICHQPKPALAGEDFALDVARYYFDPQRLARFDATFDWQAHRYFCAGVFGARRGVVSAEEWLELESWRKQAPGLFPFTDQSILNYLIYRKAARGEISISEMNLQFIPAVSQQLGHYSMAFEGYGRFPRVEVPVVAHFCGIKPWAQLGHRFNRPFTAFRLQHCRNLGQSALEGWLRILWEELVVLRMRSTRKLRWLAKRLFPSPSARATTGL
jgi:hypothetical protein